MKKEQVQIGGTYVAKVSGQIAQVRIDAESRFGGWDATNVATQRKVRIKSAQRLRRRVDENGAADDEVAAAETESADDDAANAAVEDVGPEYDPDKCGTEDCNGIPVLTHLGKPLCQTCWERHCGEEQPSEAVETAGDACRPTEEPEIKTKEQENAMSKKKKSSNKQTKARPVATKAKGEKKAATKAKAPKAGGEKKPKRVSALDAAATVLKKASKPMRSQELIEAMASQGLWKSPGGKTPHATLYAAILREINEKKGEARFKKVERGLFAANA